MAKEAVKQLGNVQGEAWVVARFIDSQAYEVLQKANVKVYGYSPRLGGMTVIKNPENLKDADA